MYKILNMVGNKSIYMSKFSDNNYPKMKNIVIIAKFEDGKRLQHESYNGENAILYLHPDIGPGSKFTVVLN